MPDLSKIDPALLQRVEALISEGLDCSAIGRTVERPREWVAAVGQQLELAEYARSDHPVKQALLELYAQGDLRIVGFRNGQIVWQAIDQ